MVKYSAIWWFGNLMRQWFCFANQIFIFGLLEFIFDDLMKQASLVVQINRYLAIKIKPAALINESPNSNVAFLKVCRLKILSSSRSWRPKRIQITVCSSNCNNFPADSFHFKSHKNIRTISAWSGASPGVFTINITQFIRSWILVVEIFKWGQFKIVLVYKIYSNWHQSWMIKYTFKIEINWCK